MTRVDGDPVKLRGIGWSMVEREIMIGLIWRLILNSEEMQINVVHVIGVQE